MIFSPLRLLLASTCIFGLAGCPDSKDPQDAAYRPDRSKVIRQQYVDREEAVAESMEGRLAFQVQARKDALTRALESMTPEQREVQLQMTRIMLSNAAQKPIYAAIILQSLPDNFDVGDLDLELIRAALEEQLMAVRQRLDKYPDDGPVSVELVQDLSELTILSLTLDREEYALDYERGVVGLLDALETTGRFGEIRGGATQSFKINEAFALAAYEAALAGDDRLRSHHYFAFAPYWFMHRFKPNGVPYLTHGMTADEAQAVNAQTFAALSLLASLYPSPEIKWWFENFGQEQAGPALAVVQEYLGPDELPEDYAPPPYGLYPQAGVLFWRSSWESNADALMARGAVPDDPNSKLDAGQISWIAHGDDVLIQSNQEIKATPATAEGANSSTAEWTIPAHNVLRVGNALPETGRAPIITRELNDRGGNLRIDASEMYPELSQWHRDLFWETGGEVRIIDNVNFDYGHRDRTSVFWHLSARKPVTITPDRSRSIVEWDDFAIVLQANSPMEIQQFMAPDDDGSGREHVVLAMRTVGRPTSLRILTRILPREHGKGSASPDEAQEDQEKKQEDR